MSEPPTPPRGTLGRLTEPMPTAVAALGLTQIIAWGTTLYVLGVLGAPIAADTGWSRGLVFGGLTTGLLVSAALSTAIGRLTDTHGGRAVMTAGSVLVAIGLALLSIVTTEWAYLATWAFLGLAMRMSLYDAAFAALVQVAPARGRRAISYLTLFGGFASTIFWPIAHAMNGAIGWRSTLLAFAALNLAACVPLHWFGLARTEAAPAAATAQADTSGGAAPVLQGRNRSIAMVLFGIIFAGSAFVFGAFAVHLPAILQAFGLSAAAAVWLASLKGFAQVAGRTWEIMFAKNLRPLDLGRVSIVFIPLSLLVLMLGRATFEAALAFTLLFGISNGLVTIVRGAVPLALFGREGYGAILGILATPYLLMNAIAPTVFALIVDAWGYTTGVGVLLAVGIMVMLAIELMARWHRGLPAAPA
jgi:MFS family permease